MRIALFTEVFLPKIDGVVTRVVRTLDELAELGHEVLIFAPGDTPPSYAGFEVVRVPSVPFKPLYPELRVSFANPKIARRMADFAPDVVHAVNPAWLTAFGIFAAERRNLPLLASYHTQLENYVEPLRLGFLKDFAAWWLRFLHNKAQVNLCTSPQMVDHAVNSGIRNVNLWPKAVDTKTYHPAAGSTQMRARLTDGHPDQPLAIYVGRLSHEKNLDDLLPVVKELPELRFAMVGGGPAQEHLEQLFAGTNTVFAGYMRGAELAEAYASADLFLFPSTTETLGFVGLESMASGVPVIGARAGGIPDLFVDGESGVLVDPTGPSKTAGFVTAIKELLADESRRQAMGEAARVEAEKLSWRKATERLVEFYQLAIERSAAER